MLCASKTPPKRGKRLFRILAVLLLVGRAASAEEPPSSEPAGPQSAASDWWNDDDAPVEVTGNFRLRSELFHNFSLGRNDPPDTALWVPPSDHFFTSPAGASYGPVLCGSASEPVPCENRSQAGANLRLRLEPRINVSKRVRVLARIDLLDGLVLGSTPQGADRDARLACDIDENGRPRSCYDVEWPTASQLPPEAGRNSLRDSAQVKRAWAEVDLDVARLSFGRMPEHWGLGMVLNDASGFDDDQATDTDRIQVETRVEPLSLELAAAWDFANEGLIRRFPSDPQRPEYDDAQLDDVRQITLRAARLLSAADMREARTRGELVLEGGLLFKHRSQQLAAEGPARRAIWVPGTPDREAPDFEPARRDAQLMLWDAWLELMAAGWRAELEAALIVGSIGDASYEAYVERRPRSVQQLGLAMELERRLLNDRLRLSLYGGYASGDGSERRGESADGSVEPQTIAPPSYGLRGQSDYELSQFRFHPSYRVDLILHRYVLGRVQGTHYVRPGAEYDLLRTSDIQLGTALAGIWTRASAPSATSGDSAELGLELDAAIFFRHGDLSSDRFTGFRSRLEYGVLLPGEGLGSTASGGAAQPAHIVRWLLGADF